MEGSLAKVGRISDEAVGAAYLISPPIDSNIAITYKRVEEIVRKRIPEIILADPSQFDALTISSFKI